MANSDVPVIAGIRLAAVSAGLCSPARPDLVLFELPAACAVAATFTRNAFCAAPVTVAREHLACTPPRYLLANTGCANAGTGAAGLAAARACCAALAALTGVDARAVLPFSTGVIGEYLPVERIEAALPQALAALSAQHWQRAAEGIMTTDTRPKCASRSVALDGVTVSLTGIAKGAGMLHPNMATMLAYLATDAALEPALLQRLWATVVERSFNRVSVDGDTSSNDAALLLATAAAGNSCIDSERHPHYGAFEAALYELALELAQALVRDGEGAGKFVEVAVAEGASEAECLAIAWTIAHSPLVKTALCASDPNWGRILAALGRAAVKDLDMSRVDVRINDVVIAEQGARAAGYTEQQGLEAMRPRDIVIAVRLQRGQSRASVWTTDLSCDYVRINSEYRS